MQFHTAAAHAGHAGVFPRDLSVSAANAGAACVAGSRAAPSCWRPVFRGPGPGLAASAAGVQHGPAGRVGDSRSGYLGPVHPESGPPPAAAGVVVARASPACDRARRGTPARRDRRRPAHRTQRSVRLGLQERLADLTLDLPSVLVCNEGDQELRPSGLGSGHCIGTASSPVWDRAAMQVRIPGMPDGSASRTWIRSAGAALPPCGGAGRSGIRRQNENAGRGRRDTSF